MACTLYLPSRPFTCLHGPLLAFTAPTCLHGLHLLAFTACTCLHGLHLPLRPAIAFTACIPAFTALPLHHALSHEFAFTAFMLQFGPCASCSKLCLYTVSHIHQAVTHCVHMQCRLTHLRPMFCLPVALFIPCLPLTRLDNLTRMRSLSPAGLFAFYVRAGPITFPWMPSLIAPAVSLPHLLPVTRTTV